MVRTLKDIDQFVENMDLPSKDRYDLPSSDKMFPDGAHWRTEISGIETAAVLEAALDEARKRKITIHRIMATVNGSTFYDMDELKALAKLARDEKIEAVVTIGPRKAWDVGARELSAWGETGFRLRGSDSIRSFFADIMRCLEAGMRGFLIYDEGVLSILAQMRKEGFIPEETVFKWSVYGGYCSGPGARIIESLGANTLNPTSDVSLPILASIRKAISIPLDVYMCPFDAMGGEFRVYEAAEIARIASPCYFKFEPGTSDKEVYRPWIAEDWVKDFVRVKVKMAAIVKEIVERHGPQIKLSEKGPSDLVLPAP
jgi:hypothetical protein